jgi:hypothetical protein
VGARLKPCDQANTRLDIFLLRIFPYAGKGINVFVRVCGYARFRKSLAMLIYLMLDMLCAVLKCMNA